MIESRLNVIDSIFLNYTHGFNVVRDFFFFFFFFFFTERTYQNSFYKFYHIKQYRTENEDVASDVQAQFAILLCSCRINIYMSTFSGVAVYKNTSHIMMNPALRTRVS